MSQRSITAVQKSFLMMKSQLKVRLSFTAGKRKEESSDAEISIIAYELKTGEGLNGVMAFSANA